MSLCTREAKRAPCRSAAALGLVASKMLTNPLLSLERRTGNCDSGILSANSVDCTVRKGLGRNSALGLSHFSPKGVADAIKTELRFLLSLFSFFLRMHLRCVGPGNEHSRVSNSEYGHFGTLGSRQYQFCRDACSEQPEHSLANSVFSFWLPWDNCDFLRRKGGGRPCLRRGLASTKQNPACRLIPE